MESITALYTAHHRWLRNWLRARLDDRHGAEDLAHDTFMRLLARDEPIQAREPRALLTTIAQRVLFTHWRRKALEAAWLQTLASVPPAHHPSPEDQLMLFETLVEVDQQLSGLPLGVKRAFLLSQLDGLTHAQVAERLNISIATVKRHVARAMRQCYFADVDFSTAA